MEVAVTTEVAVAIVSVGCVVIAVIHEEMGIRRERRRHAREASEEQRRQLLAAIYTPWVEASPVDAEVQAWTPEERETLGVNDTITLISRIDKELGTEYAAAKITPGEHVRMSKNVHITQEAS
jgi:hypothetical protein